MLGRKDFTRDEMSAARTAVDQQLTEFRGLRDAGAAEPAFFEAALLALDRRFVHRVRMVTGKDNNPLNEVELLVESIIDHGGVLRANTVIKYQPETAVLHLPIGGRIELSADQFEALANAFLAELAVRFGG